jgi:hypothetical protein
MEHHFEQYCELELIPDLRPSPFDFQPRITRMWDVGKLIVYRLASGHEPIIRKCTTTQGEVKWRVYDPVGDRVSMLNSEQEVHDWLKNLRN